MSRWLCQYVDCPTPDQPIVGYGNRKFHPRCALAQQQLRLKARNSGIGKGRWVREPKDDTTKDTTYQESPDVIEAAFKAALLEIRRRPRPEPELRYNSTLHGLRGTGL